MAMTVQINEESSITTDHDRTDAPHKEKMYVQPVQMQSHNQSHRQSSIFLA